MNKPKAGDIVRLKSGGPKMTVDDIIAPSNMPESARCVWFDGNERKSQVFSLDSLVLVADNEH